LPERGAFGIGCGKSCRRGGIVQSGLVFACRTGDPLVMTAALT